MKILEFSVVALVLMCAPSLAAQNIPDQYPGSLLYSKPIEVIPNVWTSIGQTSPSTYENAGHNNNLGFIVTSEGVVVINGGASYQLAAALHKEIKAITEQPVKLVFNENGQGHAMLGNSYWVDQGVKMVAHVDAAREFKESGEQSLRAEKTRVKERADKTRVVEPTETFEDVYEVNMGGLQIEARYLGPAHSPGDIVVWLPQKGLVIAGDMAFHERMLPIFEHTMTADWIETWDTKFEALKATYVIPGHGHPTNMDQVRRYTRDYLIYLRKAIGAHLENGGGLAEAYYIDQSPYSHLDTFEELATKNAGRVFEQMEFE